MSVTDSYTQSQTRLHNSVTELDTATAHWRRNAANAHLAAASAGHGDPAITRIAAPYQRVASKKDIPESAHPRRNYRA